MPLNVLSFYPQAENVHNRLKVKVPLGVSEGCVCMCVGVSV